MKYRLIERIFYSSLNMILKLPLTPSLFESLSAELGNCSLF
jgi:hypothetical protein